MPGILPEASAGGLVIRDGGLCTPQPNVLNAYCPPASFSSTCDLTALPSDCTARINPSQINGIVSELMCFAASLNPDGQWNCASLCNLAANFDAWWAENKPKGDGQTISVNDPYTILPIGVVNAICENDTAADTLAECLISGQGGNVLDQGADGRLFVGAIPTVEAICATPAAAIALSECVISQDVGNQITQGSDGKLLVAPEPCPVMIASCNDYVRATDVDGQNCRLIRQLPEPMEFGNQQGTNIFQHTFVLSDLPGFGISNSLFSPIIPLSLFNFDEECRSLNVNVFVRQGMRLRSASIGDAVTIAGYTLYSPAAAGAMVVDGIESLSQSIPATTVANRLMVQRVTDSRLRPYSILIPPGGTATIRLQMQVFAYDAAGLAAINSHGAGNVTAEWQANVALFGRTL